MSSKFEKNKKKLSPMSKSLDVYKRKEISKGQGKYNLGSSIRFLFVRSLYRHSSGAARDPLLAKYERRIGGGYNPLLAQEELGHSLPVVPTPHLRSVIHYLHKSNWYQIQTLTTCYSHSASPISNPSIACTREIGTRFRHSQPVVRTQYLRSAIHCLLKRNWYQIQTLTVYCSHSASPISNPIIACIRGICTRFRHSQATVPTQHLRSAIRTLHRSNWY